MYVETGYMDADDDVTFRTHAEACNCFGHTYELWLRALARHPVEAELTIWFPRLYDNVIWDNAISEDEDTIYERRIEDNAGYIQEALERPGDFKRLVFVGMKDSNGRPLYCFKGLYEVDVEASQKNSAMTYKRKKKRVTTYAPAATCS